MKKRMCPYEKDVLEGLRERKLTPELQKHVSGCRVCENVVMAHTWMGQFRERALNIDMPGKNLPDARSLWDKAFAGKRPDKRLVTKALRPLIVPQVLSFFVFFAGSIYLGIKGVFRFGDIFESPAAARIFPFFLVLTGMSLLSVIFCGLLLALEKRKRPI